MIAVIAIAVGNLLVVFNCVVLIGFVCSFFATLLAHLLFWKSEEDDHEDFVSLLTGNSSDAVLEHHENDEQEDQPCANPLLVNFDRFVSASAQAWQTLVHAVEIATPAAEGVFQTEAISEQVTACKEETCSAGVTEESALQAAVKESALQSAIEPPSKPKPEPAEEDDALVLLSMSELLEFFKSNFNMIFTFDATANTGEDAHAGLDKTDARFYESLLCLKAAFENRPRLSLNSPGLALGWNVIVSSKKKERVSSCLLKQQNGEKSWTVEVETNTALGSSQEEGHWAQAILSFVDLEPLLRDCAVCLSAGVHGRVSLAFFGTAFECADAVIQAARQLSGSWHKLLVREGVKQIEFMGESSQAGGEYKQPDATFESRDTGLCLRVTSFQALHSFSYDDLMRIRTVAAV